jgi:hypothetical protein
LPDDGAQLQLFLQPSIAISILAEMIQVGRLRIPRMRSVADVR